MKNCVVMLPANGHCRRNACQKPLYRAIETGFTSCTLRWHLALRFRTAGYIDSHPAGLGAQGIQGMHGRTTAYPQQR
ncbi:MAG: hypothetical protein LBF89_08055 [Bacteroidales bacterium]|nr:hypothetical protein [Bacteroidales bacterium]